MVEYVCKLLGLTANTVIIIIIVSHKMMAYICSPSKWGGGGGLRHKTIKLGCGFHDGTTTQARGVAAAACSSMRRFQQSVTK